MGVLDGRVALVTGGARGIGRAVCLELARHGASLAVNYRASVDLARALQTELAALGAPAEIFRADVSVRSEVQAMVQSVLDRYGRIDILVNNAGIIRDRTLVKMSAAEWSDVIRVDLEGAFNCSQCVVPSMIRQRDGRIVNIASVVGQAGAFGQTNYAAAKAGLIGFTKALALELARCGTTVNAVCPGYVETDMLKSVPADARAGILRHVPLQRFGRPEEIAGAVRFLVVDGAYVTGQVLGVNGGLLMA